MRPETRAAARCKRGIDDGRHVYFGQANRYATQISSKNGVRFSVVRARISRDSVRVKSRGERATAGCIGWNFSNGIIRKRRNRRSWRGWKAQHRKRIAAKLTRDNGQMT